MLQRRGATANFAGFVDRSKAFQAWYNSNATKVYFTSAELRIKELYEWFKLGIRPWEWDLERYGGENSDMIGFFYLDDIQNIRQLDRMEKEARRRQHQQ